MAENIKVVACESESQKAAEGNKLDACHVSVCVYVHTVHAFDIQTAVGGLHCVPVKTASCVCFYCLHTQHVCTVCLSAFQGSVMNENMHCNEHNDV